MRKAIGWIICAIALSAGVARADQVADLEARVKAELKKIDARLKLTADQKDKLKGMLEEKWSKMDALDQEYRAKMRDVLTPAQQTEWDKIKSEYRAKMKGK
jgi:hypothetical protein